MFFDPLSLQKVAIMAPFLGQEVSSQEGVSIFKASVTFMCIHVVHDC